MDRRERGAKVTPRAGDGSDPRAPMVIEREELDLSLLRAHCRQMHRQAGLPRANVALAGWHAREHHRRHLDHVHRGLWVVIGWPSFLPAVEIARPMGWYTGQDPVSRAQVDEELRERLSSRTDR
jgi:hypothetical protein